MNIQEELRISNYQPISFLKDSEMGDLYEAMVEKWRLYGKDRGGAFTASLFYNLGRTHGIREERARKRKKKSQIIISQEWLVIQEKPEDRARRRGKRK